MAKSPINALINEDEIKRQEKPSRNDVVTFIKQGGNRTMDLSVLVHQMCDVNKPKITDGVRLTHIDKIKNQIHKAIESGQLSRGRQIFYNTKLYITIADTHNLDPFSKEGWKQYFGVHGYLWGLVTDGERQCTHAFMYDNNQSVGISEKSASLIKRVTKNAFSKLSLPIFEWDKGLKGFSVEGKPKELTQPLTQREQDDTLNSLHEMFFLLAPTLIAEHLIDPKFIISNTNFHVKIIESLQYKNDKIANDLEFLKHMSAIDVFNNTMKFGYLLLSHYTAFNDSVLTSVRRPIEVVTEKIEGKISTYGTIKGYKGRAHMDVTAILAEEVSESDLSELNTTDYEEVHARIDKRTGMTFLNTLLKLADTFNPEKNGLLLFKLDKDGHPSELATDISSDVTARQLELFADKRIGLADRFAENIITLLDSSYIEKVKVRTGEDSIKRVFKAKNYYQRTAHANYRFAVIMHRLSLAFVQCFTNQSLKDTKLPLYFSEPDEKGKITVTCTTTDGDKIITLYLDERYSPVLRRIEAWANSVFDGQDWDQSKLSRNEYGNADGAPSISVAHSKRLPYLFPNSTYSRNKTKNYTILPSFLQDLGIKIDHFYLALNASRLRLTVANNEYRKGSDISALAILQNSKAVFEKHYSNGHEGENNEIIAQAIDVIEEIINGVNLEQAKDIVRENWKIEVLTFDEYKKKKKPSNPNGVSCDGKPDFKGTEQKLAQNEAKKLGVTGEDSKIHCYQYDKCDGCLNAKLIEEPYQVYKLLSFIESLVDAADLHPENAEELERRIESFESLLNENISDETINKAEEILDEKGRYFMFA